MHLHELIMEDGRLMLHGILETQEHNALAAEGFFLRL
jgi:hypothetical protein